MNPRYFMDLGTNFQLGVGPGFGDVWTDVDGRKSSDVWSLQAGIDLDYRQDLFCFGIGTRYQWTENQRFGPRADGIDNLLTSVKVGFYF